MDVIKSNLTLLKPEVLLRFRLCTDAEHPTDMPLSPDTWVDFDTAFGPHFQSGTEHHLLRLGPECPDNWYVVAKEPYLNQTTHPNYGDKKLLMATLYLKPVDATA
jgi:hypothetical protein